MTNTRGRKAVGEKAPVTGGDKGSKNNNDFEGSGGADRAPIHEGAEEPKAAAGNETKNHSQVAAVPGPDDDPKRKLRKTSKREQGSRKPGTELTQAERAAL
jgi:hypothetical protein